MKKKLLKLFPYLTTILFVFSLAIGIFLLLNRQANSFLSIDFYQNKIESLYQKKYTHFFFYSTTGFENNLLFSIILFFLNYEKMITTFLVYDLIFSIVGYISFVIAIWLENKNKLLSIFICIVAFNLFFNDNNLYFMETKITLMGCILFYLVSKNIKNVKLKFLLESLLIIFNFNIGFLIYFFVLFIDGLIKKKFKLDNMIFLIVCFVLFIFMIHPNLQISIKHFCIGFGYLFDYGLSTLPEKLEVLLSAFFMILVWLNVIVLLISQNRKKYFLFNGIFAILMIYSILIFNTSNFYRGEYLKFVYAPLFMILLDYNFFEFSSRENMNLFNNKDFHFSFYKLVYPIVLLVLVLSFFSISFEKKSSNIFLYQLKYDSYYNIESKSFVENYSSIDLIQLKELYEELGINIEYTMTENKDYTVFRNEDIFLYGFGKKEDSNGSRWSTKCSAVNMYANGGDGLVITFYNPQDRVGIHFQVYVDNELFVDEKSIIGSQSIAIPANVSAGNHIVRIEFPEYNNYTDFGLYVTNIVFCHVG